MIATFHLMDMLPYQAVDISAHPMGMAANVILFACHIERFGSLLLATWVFNNPRILNRIDSWPIRWHESSRLERERRQ
jgi:hypothetical protein